MIPGCPGIKRRWTDKAQLTEPDDPRLTVSERVWRKHVLDQFHQQNLALDQVQSLLQLIAGGRAAGLFLKWLAVTLSGFTVAAGAFIHYFRS